MMQVFITLRMIDLRGAYHVAFADLAQELRRCSRNTRVRGLGGVLGLGRLGIRIGQLRGRICVGIRSCIRVFCES